MRWVVSHFNVLLYFRFQYFTTFTVNFTMVNVIFGMVLDITIDTVRTSTQCIRTLITRGLILTAMSKSSTFIARSCINNIKHSATLVPNK